jgi:uncharacterized protein (DUF1501 family)
MNFFDDQPQSRRDFLRRSGHLAMTGTALPFALNLAAMGEAAAFNAPAGDYKALVCVFMFGGNDYGNTVIPYDDASYNKYSSIRGGGAGQTAGGIALAKAALSPTLLSPTAAPVDLQGVTRQFALHPAMTGLASLFNAGQAAVQLNVGPLVRPLTRAQYNSSNRVANPRPPQLFSHNDQQSIWQSSSPEGSTKGWGGKAGDLVVSNSVNSNSLFSCMSVSGNAVLLSGNTALQYQVNARGGAIKIKPIEPSVYGSNAFGNVMRDLIRQTGSSNRLENEYNTITARALDAEAAVSTALALTPVTSSTGTRNDRLRINGIDVDFPTDPLGQQLQMVARLIKGRSSLVGVGGRQVFFVSIGGFDLHDNLIAQHPGILGSVSAGMKAFYDATAAMGDAAKVTAFTASDFGRTLASNGDGTDHGWGSHHFVVGGAVNGRSFYGTPPPVSVSDNLVGGVYPPENQWHVGQGRLLPTTSVDQYAATLARWFGVDDTEMPGILPNIANYPAATGYSLTLPDATTLNYPRYLGFI